MNKCFALIGNLIHKVRLPMVLSRRSLATSLVRLTASGIFDWRDHAF